MLYAAITYIFLVQYNSFQHAEGVAKGAKAAFGESVYNILSNSAESSDAELLGSIRDAYADTREKIEGAEEMERDAGVASE